jgi:hypothetical protein
MPAHPELEGAELSCRVTSQNDVKRDSSECMRYAASQIVFG